MKAMILAAGRGERLRPLTDHTPKPLLPVGGRPLIEHLIAGLAAAGFDDLVVNLSHLGEQIEKHIGDGQHFGVRIAYSWEAPEPLETGGGIRQALPLLGSGPFIVVNGDIATDFPFHRLRNTPERLAHLVMIPNPPHNPAGDFVLSNGELTTTGAERLTFSGIGVYRPELFNAIEPGRFPLAPILRRAMDARAVSGERHDGFWMDSGTIERLRAIDEHLGRPPVQQHAG
ncbi:MAG: nucleotidyltransferase family protein [Methylotetracoccus sp.]